MHTHTASRPFERVTGVSDPLPRAHNRLRVTDRAGRTCAHTYTEHSLMS